MKGNFHQTAFQDKPVLETNLTDKSLQKDRRNSRWAARGWHYRGGKNPDLWAAPVAVHEASKGPKGGVHIQTQKVSKAEVSSWRLIPKLSQQYDNKCFNSSNIIVNKKSKCSDDSYSSAKLQKSGQLCLLNTYQSHKAYCAYLCNVCGNHTLFKLDWTKMKKIICGIWF